MTPHAQRGGEALIPADPKHYGDRLVFEAEKQGAVTDTLANIMHFCNESGVSFEYCLRMATFHFEEEK